MKNKVVYPSSIKEAAPFQPYVQVNAKKEIMTNLKVLCVAAFTKALSTGDKRYNKRYAFINQLSFVAKKQPATPCIDILFTPASVVIKYKPIKKNKH